MSLTAKKVRDAKASDRTRIEWDDEVKGLGLRITPAGVKSFVLSYRADGRKRLMTLGRAAEMSLARARALASETKIQIRGGGDPLEERSARRQLPTVAEGVERFFSEYVPKRMAMGRMAETTRREYFRQSNTYILTKIGKRRICDVTRHDVEKVLAPLPPIMANRVRALVSRLFTLFEHWEYRPQHTNPARGIEKAVEDARDRTLSESEFSVLGRALDQLDGNQGAILAIRLAAITGLRIGEIKNMKWEDVDFEGSFLTLPKTKTGRRIHTLPSAALALLADAPRIGACVIPGRDPDRPLDYTSIRNHWDRACDAAGIRGARLNDLRRTIMTEAAALGVGSHLLRDMVGHKTTAMADRYARRAGAPLTELRERMGASMAAKLSNSPAADLHALPWKRKD
ncbi:site-specific integrase [Limibaculum sp. FT325]|uniref:tyrosine-type recombinase/integrase n=1 Tax=Thermohalobaculum sediminis TaxID=2939436 RepID=UPI0020BE0ADE|nr:site-specific integrase [Limibaculum sediminis]MCL5776436.1 site-specific integrase [Limibaculum sediminis]